MKYKLSRLIFSMTIRLLSGEFLEKLSSGQNEFDGIEMHYADLSGRNFRGLKIRNSKFLFTVFRNCTFEDVTFENCEFFFGAFGYSTFNNVDIIKCRIEYSGFTDAIFSNSSMINTSISWTTLIGTKLGGLKMANCTEFKVVRNISEVKPEDIEDALGGLQPAIKQLDFDTQQKITQLLEGIMKRYNITMPEKTSAAKPAYGKTVSVGAGYKLFDAIIDSSVKVYGQDSAYKTKSVYETKSKYKH